MSFRIKLASSTAELDGLFRLRHKVFVEEKKYMPPSCSGRLSDCFDSYPTTANIVALLDDKVVGGLRFVEPSPAGTPADAFFDFTPYLAPDAGRVGSGSMLLVDPDYRTVPGLTHAMLGMGHYWAISRGLTHVTGISAPAAEKLFVGCGYKPVVQRFFHQPTQLYAMPVMLDVRELNARLRSFINEQSRHALDETFDRQFYQPGELILSTEDETEAAYRILGGSVAVTTEDETAASLEAQQETARRAVRVLDAGAIFSRRSLRELLVTGARAVALTELSLMVIERNEPVTSLTGISPTALAALPTIIGQMLPRSPALMYTAP